MSNATTMLRFGVNVSGANEERTKIPLVRAPKSLPVLGGQQSLEPLPGSLRHYFETALQHAHYEYLEEDEEYYAEIPGFDGLYATGQTQEAAARDLRGALEVWLRVRLSRGLPLPSVQQG